MATGTITRKAGVDTLPLPGYKDYFVYVPRFCVGSKRCPLVVYVHGGGWTSTMQLAAQRDLADKYGMILLLPNAAEEGQQDVFAAFLRGKLRGQRSPMGYTQQVLSSDDSTDVRGIDTAMQVVLRHYAIDPDKIAVMGFSNGGSYSLLLGRTNPDVFSRVGGLSALMPFYGAAPHNPTQQFLLSAGLAEKETAHHLLGVAQEIRADGYPVEVVLALRGHVALREDDNYAWNWLARSWGWHTPASAHEGPPQVLPDSDPVLTPAALQQLTAFWTRFQQEPESIKTTARKAHQEYIVLALGVASVTVVKLNVRALAAQYPAVAADLQAAGLTAAQEEAYRHAILRVGMTRTIGTFAGPIPPTSVLGRNLAFRTAHPELFTALASTQMWTTQ